jgi:hypothetical protein
VSYLLQRIRFIINFPFLSLESRQQMWEKAFPLQIPIGKLDIQHFARINSTRSSIKTTAINAAFLAAQTDTLVVT